jgi:autotransporter-associated beta strand protein
MNPFLTQLVKARPTNNRTPHAQVKDRRAWLLLSAASGLAFTGRAGAAPIYWIGGTSNAWESAANWSPNTAVPTSVNDVSFDQTSYPYQPNISSGVAVQGLIFGDGTINTAPVTIAANGPAGSLTIGADGVVDNIGSSAATISVPMTFNTAASVNNAAGSLLTFSGNVSTSSNTIKVGGTGAITMAGQVVCNGVTGGSLVKTGTGSLTLSATNNAFAGAVNVSRGSLVIAGDGSLGATSVPVIFSGAGTSLDATAIAGGLTTSRTFNVVANTTWYGNYNLAAGSLNITGSGNVTFPTPGNEVLGNVSLSSSNSSVIYFGTSSSDVLTVNGTVSTGNSSTLYFNTSAGSSAYLNGSMTGTGTVKFLGTGPVTLQGNDTGFTGSVVPNTSITLGGPTGLASNAASGSANWTLNSACYQFWIDNATAGPETIPLGSFATSLGTPTIISETSDSTQPVTLQIGAAQGVSSNAQIFGSIEDSPSTGAIISLEKVGPGTEVIGSPQFLSGSLTVTAGRLYLVNTAGEYGALPTTTPITVTGGQMFFYISNPVSNNLTIGGINYNDSNGVYEGALHLVGTLSGGVITLTSSSGVEASPGYAATIDDQITGTGGFRFDELAGANASISSVVLGNSSNSYTGDTSITIHDAPKTYANCKMTLQAAAANVIPSGPGMGNLDLNGTDANHITVFDLAGYNQTVNGLSAVNASGAVITDSVGGSILSVGAGDTSSTYIGAIIGALSLEKIGAGKLILSGSNSYSGGTTVSAGLLVASNGMSTIGSGPVTINGGGMIFGNTTSVSIFNLLKTGYDGGAWDGTGGITSDAAADDTSVLHTLGMLQPASATTFEGQALGTGDVAVKYTYYGDATLDGKVDGSDYSRIDSAYLYNETHLNSPMTGWQNGDFNYDDIIDGSDYTLIDNAFNSQGTQIQAQIATPTAQIGFAAVPEPTSLGASVGFAVASMLGRRRRRR